MPTIAHDGHVLLSEACSETEVTSHVIVALNRQNEASPTLKGEEDEEEDGETVLAVWEKAAAYNASR